MQIANVPSPSQTMIAPVTGQGNKGLMRAEIKGGVREVVACKDGEGKIGLRLRHVNNVRLRMIKINDNKINYNKKIKVTCFII